MIKEWFHIRPRRKLLKNELNRKEFTIRSLDTLCLVSGMQDEDCRSVLVRLGARGFTMDDGREGWGLIKRNKPSEQ